MTVKIIVSISLDMTFTFIDVIPEMTTICFVFRGIFVVNSAEMVVLHSLQNL